ncbi:hypothetical protein EVAR_98111_1 [Eumeta japonica]|uniref:Uncharacterized protein n=1 Tax=Eumeta variegata TaxID=151549 RepID=A0A4C1XIW4_EUMVA|nr:hypothetical protein EVAR_98111_1 [Eumeta japonica]
MKSGTGAKIGNGIGVEYEYRVGVRIKNMTDNGSVTGKTPIRKRQSLLDLRGAPEYRSDTANLEDSSPVNKPEVVWGVFLCPVSVHIEAIRRGVLLSLASPPNTPARLREMKRTANGTISGGDAPVHKSAVPLKKPSEEKIGVYVYVIPQKESAYDTVMLNKGRDGKLLISHKGKRDAEKACVVWDRANASRTVCRTTI